MMALPAFGPDAITLGLLMPARKSEKPKPKKDTWRAWNPEPAGEPAVLLTRAEFLARLNRHDLNVKESDLEYWEYQGVLPRPVRKWDPEAKARRAYYPLWMMASIFTLRLLQREGLQLRDIQPWLESSARELALVLSPTFREGAPTYSDDEIDNLMAGPALQAVFEVRVEPHLTEFMRLHDQFVTNKTTTVVVSRYDADGREHTIASLPLRSTAEALRADTPSK